MIAAIIAAGVVVAWLLMLVALSGDNRVVIPRVIRFTEIVQRANESLHELARAFARLAATAKRANEEIARAFGGRT